MRSTPLPPDERRRAARARRAALGPAERAAAERAVRDHLLADARFRAASRLAAYLATGSELDLAPTLASLAPSQALYLPRLRQGRCRMSFARHRPGDPLVSNRHLILQPGAAAPVVSARSLALILLPLVGFDAQGNRLGSGAGYYDRSLAFRLGPDAPDAPLLYGIAFDCQRLPALVPHAWDVPLDAVVTERGIERWR